MKKQHTLLFFLLLVFWSSALQAQDCGTDKPDPTIVPHLPWYGNNQYLYDLIDSLELARGSQVLYQQGQGILPTEVGGVTQSLFQVPVKNWIFQNDDGTAPALINEADAERFANRTNQSYRENIHGEIGILLYTNCESERVNSTVMNSTATRPIFDFAASVWREPHVVNVHFVEDIDDNLGFVGRARFPWQSSPYVFAIETRTGVFNDTGINGDDNWATYNHELGHCFGLVHTAESFRGSELVNGLEKPCMQEYVSRNAINHWNDGCLGTHGDLKCEINGDILCDTDANPGINLSGRVEVTDDNTCAWNPIFVPPNFTPVFVLQDEGGTPFFSNGRDNSLRNFMTARLRPACRQEFTQGQTGVMYDAILGGRDIEYGEVDLNPDMFHTNPHIDVFENDNFPETATTVIPLDAERQHHTFHQTPRWDGEAVQFTNCDIDWLSFQIPPNVGNTARQVFIHTEEVVGEERPNIRLRLYQEDPTTNVRTLLQEVNDPASEFSTIVENLVPGLNAFLPYTYYVEVINDEGGTWPSHYIITISYDQAGGNGGNGGSPTLTGATQGPNGWFICGGGQLGLANIPAGCTVTWSTTDAQTSSVLSSNGSLAAHSTNSPGFMLRATATVVCGGVSMQNYQVEV